MAEQLQEQTPESIIGAKSEYERELELLQQIQPHAIITTNYDQFLEKVFPQYETVIGQKIIEQGYQYIGEIFKIHGCTSDPESLVLTKDDLTTFNEQKKYLSAKLLTYFSEHPMLIVGYQPNDTNIRKILSDVKTILPDGESAKNIYLLNYQQNVSEEDYPQTEKIISLSDGEQMRLKYIEADSFEWVYEAFSTGGELEGINVNLLRKLMANTYEIVAEKAPKRQIHFEQLEYAADSENLATLFGITPIGEPSPFSDRTSHSSFQSEDGGLPVEEILTGDPENDINKQLTTAVKNWTSNQNLITNRNRLYEFVRDIDSLNLTDRKAEFLFRSSIQAYSHGTTWLESFNGDVNTLFEDTLREDVDGRTLPVLERVLLVYGEQSLLEIIESSTEYSSQHSKAARYADLCDESIIERISAYVTDSVRLQDEKYSIEDLFTDPNQTEDLLFETIELLLIEFDDYESQKLRAALRNLEIIRLGQIVDESPIYA